MLNNSQRINVLVNYKDLNFMQILVKENDLVYETIKKNYNGENDILVVSQDQVCYFDESFSQFKNRTSKDQDLNIVVKSLKEIYSKSMDKQNEKLIDFQNENYELIQVDQPLQSNYSQLQTKLQESQIEQKNELLLISSDGIQTTFDSQSLEQIFHKKSIELILKVITDIKKPLLQPNCKSNESKIQFEKEDTQVISLIETCIFCNNPTDEKIIQLTCYHKFHEDCLISLFFSQLSNQNRVLSCLCLQKQSAPILQHIKDQNSSILLRHKLLQNQLNAIIQKDKLEKCQKPACYFYFKRNNQLLLQKSYCPLCLS